MEISGGKFEEIQPKKRPGICFNQTIMPNKQKLKQRTHIRSVVFVFKQKKKYNLFSLKPLSGCANYICSTFSFFHFFFIVVVGWPVFFGICQVSFSSQHFLPKTIFISILV